jgi:N-acyl-D-amino-acid deacylase
MANDYDLVIRGGTVVDGSGGAPFEADVGVKRGVIAAVGRVLGRGDEEVSADGLLVTPGFVDIHTHYDGQVTWESRLSPSSDHGVTTVMTGNCGVGFAPCHPDDREELIALMAGVEDIPEVVMAEGLPWNWESFGDYLNSVDAHAHDADIATMIPHSALRVYVMRQRAVDREPATAEDRARMAELTREAMAAGALGFGTSRAIQQKSIRGQPIPTVGAAEDELRSILAAMAGTGRGVFQALSDFEQFKSVDAEFGMFRRLVAETGRPMSFTLNQKHGDPDGWRRLLDLTDQANADGLTIRGQVLGRPTGLLLGHELSLNPFVHCPSYAALAKLPFDQRIAALRTAEMRATLLAEAEQTAHLNRVRGVRDWTRIFELSDPPNYEPPLEESIAAKAAAQGVAPEGLVYDLLLQDGGRRLLLQTAQNYAGYSLEPSLEMIRDPHTILGLGDGGAHCGLVCDASYPTTMLAYWSRDRRRGDRLPMPQVVRKLSADTAAAVGLNDRGRIAPGLKADLNVIDYDRLQLRSPQVVYDMPAGGRRIVQRADGYVATFVSGQATYREGASTGALPGRVVRGPQPAPR